MEPTSKCVVIVPVAHSIEPQCDNGLRELERRGYPVQRVWGHSAIDYGRSVMASKALMDGFNEIMWIDSDMGFNPDDVDKLRGHGLPICSGTAVTKDGKRLTCTFAGGGNIPLGDKGGLHEALYNGFAFAHTRREVYDKIKSAFNLPECSDSQFGLIVPYFISAVINDGSTWQYLPEDAAFCHRVRKAGIKLMADTTVRLSHIGRYPYSWIDLFSTHNRDERGLPIES